MDTNGDQDVFIIDLANGGVISRISNDSSGNASNGNSNTPVFSPDGTKLFFLSESTNLTPGAVSGDAHEYVVDLANGNAISRLDNTSAGNAANSISEDPSVSSDGLNIAFASPASDIGTSPDAGTNYDVFVKNAGTITRVSNTNTGAPPNSDSLDPAFSPTNPNFLAFISSAGDLQGGAVDTNHAQNLYIKNISSGATFLVSTTTDGSPLANGGVDGFVFSADGTKIAFTSDATNLTADADTNVSDDVFVADISNLTASTPGPVVVTRITNGNDDSYDPIFSPDGHKLAFTSDATDLTSGTDTNSGSDIFISDLTSGNALTRVTNNGMNAANDQSDTPAFSPDSQSLAFSSDATDIDGATTTVGGNVFLANISNLAAINSSLVSAKSNNDGGNATSDIPVFLNNSQIAFSSFATDLDPVGAGMPSFNRQLLLATLNAPTVDLSTTAVSLSEGNSGSTAFEYTLTRTGNAIPVLAVNYSIVGSGANAASSSDFTSGITDGVVTFASGATTATITVNVAGDTSVEDDETFTLSLTDATGATLGTTTSADGTILNDDLAGGSSNNGGSGGGGGGGGGGGVAGGGGSTPTPTPTPPTTTVPPNDTTPPGDTTPPPIPNTPVVTTGITGERYTTTVSTFDDAGNLIETSYLKENGKLYFDATVATFPNGSSSYTYSRGSFFRGKNFTSFTDSYDSKGNLTTHVEDNRDGSHLTEIDGNRQVVNALGTDTFFDAGSRTQFVFSPGVGSATIYGFHAGGAGHDTISLPSSDAGRLAQILAHATDDGQGNTTLHLGHGDTITFAAVSVAQLQKHAGDFVFHA